MLDKLHDAFSHIIFSEDGHAYYNTKENKQLVSVTTEKKNYLIPFDKSLVIKCAEREGCTPEELQFKWDEAGRIGRERGTLLHWYCSNLALRKYVKIDTTLYPHMDNLIGQIHNFFRDYAHWKTLAVECVIGDDKNGGQFDRIVEDIDGSIYVADYKFQRTFKDSYGKYMLEPYDKYPQDSLHEYGFQMSLYKRILEDNGFKIDGLKLVHFNYEDTNYRIYDAPQIDIV